MKRYIAIFFLILCFSYSCTFGEKEETTLVKKRKTIQTSVIQKKIELEQTKIDHFSQIEKNKIIITSHLYPAKLRELKNFREVIDKINPAKIFVLGDIGFDPIKLISQAWVEDLSKKYSIKNLLGNADPTSKSDWGNLGLVNIANVYDDPFWSEDIGDYKFLMLSTMECNGKNNHEGCWYSTEQLKFIKSELQKSIKQGRKGVVVLQHHAFWINGFHKDRHTEEIVNTQSCRQDDFNVLRCPWHDTSLNNSWKTELHPEFVRMADQGMDVHVIAGDASFVGKFELDAVKYHFVGFRGDREVWDWFTPDMIEFLGLSFGQDGYIQIKSFSFLRPQ